MFKINGVGPLNFRAQPQIDQNALAGLASRITGICMLSFAASISAVAASTGQQADGAYSEFRPAGYSSLVPLEFGRGPLLSHYTLQLTQVRVPSDTYMCEGLDAYEVDVIAVTSTAPIVGSIPPEAFQLKVCRLVDSADPSYDYREWPDTDDPSLCELFRPSCVRLQLEDEPNERRTVLLIGQFLEVDDKQLVYAPKFFSRDGVIAVVDGSQTNGYTPEDTMGIGTCGRSLAMT